MIQAKPGVSACRNLGISRAKSNFIALLDSDDQWHPTKIEKQVIIESLVPNLSNRLPSIIRPKILKAPMEESIITA